MEQMSTGQYAALIGKTRQDVHYRVKTGKPMPGVLKHKVIAGRLILTVEKNKIKKDR